MKRYFVLPGLTTVIVAGLIVWGYLNRFQMPVLDPRGPIALAESHVILITVLLCAVVVVPVFLMLFIFAWMFRASNPNAKKEHKPNWDHDNALAEFAWWVVPSLIIAFLGLVAWQSAHELDPYLPIKSDVAPITVQVVALDWKWLFIYPDQGIATVNYLEFPENTPVHFEITSDAPMNSFWIPSLGGQIMAMPGMQTQLNLAADGTGEYNGMSANISGRGFAGMTFKAKSVSSSDFDAWVKSIRTKNNPLNESTYEALVKPSEYVPVSYYAPIDQSLYTKSITKYMDMTSTNSP
jgi:cytochrome o ubiquinol oxidase subunit 2